MEHGELHEVGEIGPGARERGGDMTHRAARLAGEIARVADAVLCVEVRLARHEHVLVAAQGLAVVGGGETRRPVALAADVKARQHRACSWSSVTG